MTPNRLLVLLALLAGLGTSMIPQSTPSNTSVTAASVNLPRCVAISPGNPQFEPLRKVCDFALSSKLPDFICDETVQRFSGNSKRSKWKKVDVVTAELTSENGSDERYSNVAVNARPPLKIPGGLGAYELGEYLNRFSRGTWAGGLFGGYLASIFWPTSRTKFELRGENGGSPTPAPVLFTFQIDRASSPFSLVAGPGTERERIRVGAKGSIWIDKATSRLIRLEIQDTEIDTSLPVKAAASVVDYAETPIGDLGTFLLPLDSEFLACNDNRCYRNLTNFRNWRKFGSEVHIILER